MAKRTTKATKTAKATTTATTTERPIDKLGARIAADMIAAMEQGTAPWVMPWDPARAGCNAQLPRNALTGRAYRGGNVFHLWIVAGVKGYVAPRWLTFKQAQAGGGTVRAGEKGTEVFFFKKAEREITLPDGTIEKRGAWIARVYYVFNVAQCDGLRESIAGGPAVTPVADPVAALDAATARAWADVTERGIVAVTLDADRAAYSPTLDKIILPALGNFRSGADAAATGLHEMVHATGHVSRLDRLKDARFGSETYAKEELVAELGSAILCAAYGIPGQLQHASYLQHWIGVLKAEPGFLMTAATAAQKAVDLLVKAWGVSVDDAAGAEEADGEAGEALAA